MEDFKKELDALLQRFPELPEFKLTVRPRVVIETKQETKPFDPLSSSFNPFQENTPEMKKYLGLDKPAEANPAATDALNNILSRNPNIKVYEQ